MNNENKTCVPMYRCGICDKAHKTIAERIKCETACLKKQEDEERKAAELKKAAEYEARITEVNMAFDRAYELRNKFVKDYGKYQYQRKCNSLDECNSLDDVLNFILGV